jgi:hypothetical protein
MSDETSPGAKIDPEGQYRILITSKVVIDDLRLLPRNDNIVKGELLLKILDQVETYELVE